MRAKIDTRPGAWSSWWAVGDFLDVPWPKNGEIDIMDAFQGLGGSRVVPVWDVSHWHCRNHALTCWFLRSFVSISSRKHLRKCLGRGYVSSQVGISLVPFAIFAASPSPGMLKASVIHADETGEPSSAIFHGAARKVTAEACLDRRSVGTRHTLLRRYAVCARCVPSWELTYPIRNHFWVDAFPFPVWWNMLSFHGG